MPSLARTGTTLDRALDGTQATARPRPRSDGPSRMRFPRSKPYPATGPIIALTLLNPSVGGAKGPSNAREVRSAVTALHRPIVHAIIQPTQHDPAAGSRRRGPTAHRPRWPSPPGDLSHGRRHR